MLYVQRQADVHSITTNKCRQKLNLVLKIKAQIKDRQYLTCEKKVLCFKLLKTHFFPFLEKSKAMRSSPFLVACAVSFVLLVLPQVVVTQACTGLKNCSACTATSGCMWAL